ncbi:MAG: galactokinase [Bacteroidia bacterium]
MLRLPDALYTHTLHIQAPGRVNLIGEHTDYNEGYVLPGAIDKGIRFLIGAHAGTTCVLHALDLGETYAFEIGAVPGPDAEMPGWARYLVGIVAQFQQAGYAVGAFNASFGGDIPIGSGLSSSAALECGLAYGLDLLYGLRIGRMELAHIGQRAEHSYPRVMCGLMDQFASLHGRADHVVRLDCRSLSYAYFPFDTHDYRLLLCNTRVSHSLAGSEYNTRRQECETGVAMLRAHGLDIASLRDATPEMLAAYGYLLPQGVLQRCRYVVEENQRVIQACEALAQGDLGLFGQLMYASHEGLQYEYEVSCAELDLLVAAAREEPAILGARMMGGGFGGCTINLVRADEIDGVATRLSTAYRAAFGFDPETHVVRLVDGVHTLE